LKAFRVLAGAGYPFLAWAALNLFRPRTVSLVLCGALVCRLLSRGRHRDYRHVRRLVPLGAGIGAILGMAAILDEGRLFLFVPSLVNLALLVAFGRTFYRGPSMVETFARLQGYRLSDEKIRYCRRVTAVWCVFFAINSAAIAWLAVWASLAWWTMYTGIIAYVLVGALFAAEVVYRAWRFRDYRDGAVDRMLRVVLPPRGHGP
jgi:uncharacterized membrane protein